MRPGQHRDDGARGMRETGEGGVACAHLGAGCWLQAPECARGPAACWCGAGLDALACSRSVLSLRGGNSDSAPVRVRATDANARDNEVLGSPACRRTVEGPDRRPREDGGPEGRRLEEAQGDVVRTGRWAAGREIVFRARKEMANDDAGLGALAEGRDDESGGGQVPGPMQLALGAAMEQLQAEMEREQARCSGAQTRPGHVPARPPAAPADPAAEGPVELLIANKALATDESSSLSQSEEEGTGACASQLRRLRVSLDGLLLTTGAPMCEGDEDAVVQEVLYCVMKLCVIEFIVRMIMIVLVIVM